MERARSDLLRAIIIACIVALLFVCVQWVQIHRQISEVREIQGGIDSTIPEVSLLSDLAIHSLSVDLALVQTCRQRVGTGDLACQAFVNELEKQWFDEEGIDNWQFLDYIYQARAANELLIAGWRQADSAKWEEGTVKWQAALHTLTLAFEPTRY